jgi:hypothetical protein
MEIIQYPADECDRYICATGILGEVIARCAKLSYNTDDEEIKAAILEFETPYAIWRNTLKIADNASVERVYADVKPLIDKNKITVDYILQHSRYALVS